MRRIVLEITMDGDRICAASVREQINPLRGFWRRWSRFDQSANRSARITTTAVLDGLREAIKEPSHG